MSYRKTYLIPTEELTDTDKRSFRDLAADGAVRLAIEQKIASTPEELDLRAFENIFDAGTALDQWNTAALAAVGTAYSVFQAVAAPTLAANKVVAFYKVGVETVPLPVSLLTFRSGGAVGNIEAEFDLEQLVNALETEGYFTRPVVFGPTRQFAVQVTARIATGVLARVQLGGWIVEPKGQRFAG